MNPALKIAALAALAATANAQAFNWTLETPGTSPSARERTATGTDGSTYYMYGGQNTTVTAGYDELWTYDGVTWTLVTVSGAGCGVRAGGIGTYDIARGKFVVFGGKLGFGATDPRLNDTWEWDATNGWVQITTATVPPATWLTPGVYVPGLGMMFHGGNQLNASGTAIQGNETWLYTGGDWVQMSTSGPAVQDPMLVYRAGTNDLLLHGGNNPNGLGGVVANGETWRFDLGTGQWSQIITATTPTSTVNGQNLFAAMCYYNPNTGNVIVHGGNGGNSNTSTWQFDGVNWKNISTNGTGCRNGAAHWMTALGKAVYGPCNEVNGAKNRTRSHGPATVAAVASYGSGCNGQAGTPLTFASDNDPWTANTWNGTCTGMSAASGIKLGIWGFATAGLPITGLLGAGPGCFLLNSNDYLDVAVAATTSHTISFAIPPAPALAGAQINVQAGEVDFFLNNLATSNGLTLTIGG